LKPVRRAQAITPFGVGAMVDFPGPTSLIHAGLDAWPLPVNPDLREEFIVEDSRLSKRLGVDFFVLPPDHREKPIGVDGDSGNFFLKLPFLRFPLWHVCPVCGLMHKAKYHHSTAPVCKGPYSTGENKNKSHGSRATIQVRFVAACDKGHLQDFPWLEWLKLDDSQWRPDGHLRWLRLRSNGNAGADGIEIIAEEHTGGQIKEVGKKRLTGALGGDVDSGTSPLGNKGIKCSGHNPVLAIGEHNAKGCGQNLYVQLRGASSLYFADIKSSIYIPEIDDSGINPEILDLLENDSFLRELLKHAKANDSDGTLTEKKAAFQLNESTPESQVDPKELAAVVNKYYLKDILTKDANAREALVQLTKVNNDQLTVGIIKDVINSSRSLRLWAVDPNAILLALKQWYLKDISQSEAFDSTNENEAEVAYRSDEYKIFCRDHFDGLAKTNLLIKSSKIDDYSELIQENFDRISLLHKLRETRAFSGFSRIFAKSSINKSDRVGLISNFPKNWLPAVIVRGEGIFIKFRLDKLQAWEKEFGLIHRKRLDEINRNLGELREKRHQNEFVVSPRFALLHTFAHIVINQLVFDCGYSSASLRERVYCSDKAGSEMAGVLIYTAAGDSEGTLGGLVRMGQPGYLEKTIHRALEKSKWCSADPICIESKGQGPDSCNLAACHSCALIPETSCEEQNRLLDRGVVIGPLFEPRSGFFNFNT